MKSEALERISKLIFEASERLREALDEIDLGGIETESTEVAQLEATQSELEKTAQRFQRRARQ